MLTWFGGKHIYLLSVCRSGDGQRYPNRVYRRDGQSAHGHEGVFSKVCPNPSPRAAANAVPETSPRWIIYTIGFVAGFGPTIQVQNNGVERRV